MRLLLTALFAVSFSALAQMQLTLLTPDGELPATATMDLGSAPSGGQQSFIFRIRNMGQSTASVTRISVSGQGFALTSSPPLPLPLQPGMNSDFRIRFAPSGPGAYSANLVVNTASSILRATAAAEPRLLADVNGVMSIISPGDVISIGNTERGTKLTKRLVVENSNGTPVILQSARIIIGSAFSILPVAAPLELAPGDRTSIDLTFAPTSSGVFTGSIDVNGRSYGLTANGLEPAVPEPTLAIEGDLVSAKQPKLVIRFAEPSRTTANGTLTMDFVPAAGAVNDAAIRFIGSGGVRQQSVRLEIGGTAAMVGTLAEAPFQTGTTAGTFVFTLKLGPHTKELRASVPRAAIHLDGGAALRRVNDLDVSLSGFDNSRSVSQALFTFYEANGRPVAPGTIRVDTTQEFTQFFSRSDAGGLFLLRATFPVTGPAADITEVEVELVNGVAGTRTERLKIR